MIANGLNELYGAVISPAAAVEIPEHWLPAVHEALAAFRDLPSPICSFMIVLGIRSENGIGATPDFMPADGLTRIGEIVEKAQAAVKASMH
ncbi:hypothetical protein AB4Z34_21790 [Ensifer sp. 2YAB10]|uniref:hypothetical protein n=1 Tax=unclassified Ensifer TaxID=2633371 RepID=UPI003F8FD0CD